MLPLCIAATDTVTTGGGGAGITGATGAAVVVVVVATGAGTAGAAVVDVDGLARRALVGSASVRTVVARAS
jgi:hypothetical protein